MKRITIGLAIMIGLGFAACGKSGGGSTADVPAPAIGIGPIGPGATAPQCQIGQVYAQGYGCLARGSCNDGYGWVPGESRCVPGTVVSEQTVFGGSYLARFYGMLTIVNPQSFTQMLQYAGLCNRYTWNYGSWDCSSWTNKGGFIEIKSFGGSTSNQVNMYIGAGNPAQGYLPYGYQSGSTSIGFSQTASVVAYNNNAGIQIIGTSWGGQDVGLRLIVPSGRLSDQGFNAEVWYQNAKMATVTVRRY